jgi:hypothetical protein
MSDFCPECFRDPCTCSLPSPEPRDGNDLTGDRGIRLRPASTVKTKRAKWFMRPLIPAGSLTLLAGREGLGKSTFSLHLVALATRGKLPDTDLHGPATVILITNEDAPEFTIVPRLIAAGADLSRVHFAAAVTALGTVTGVTLPLDTERITQAAREVGAALIIVDPLVSVLDGKLDSHKDHSIRQALDPLNRLAERTGCSVLGLVHLNKGQGADLLDRVLGSRAFTAAARSVIGVVEDPEDDGTRLVVHAKSNLGAKSPDAIVFRVASAAVPTDDGEIADVGVAEILGTRPIDLSDVMTASGTDESEEVSDVGAWLLTYLRDQGGESLRVDVMEAAKKAGHSMDQVKRARKRTGVVSERTQEVPSRTMWFHPSATLSARLALSAHGTLVSQTSTRSALSAPSEVSA